MTTNIKDYSTTQASNTSLNSIDVDRSEEHTSELQSQSTKSYDVFCLKKKKKKEKDRMIKFLNGGK